MHSAKMMDTIIVLATIVGNPNPTGNMTINGIIIVNKGNSKIAINTMFGFFCLTNTNKLTKLKYTGIIKKLAPSNFIAITVQRINQNKMGGTVKLAVFSGL